MPRLGFIFSIIARMELQGNPHILDVMSSENGVVSIFFRYNLVRNGSPNWEWFSINERESFLSKYCHVGYKKTGQLVLSSYWLRDKVLIPEPINFHKINNGVPLYFRNLFETSFLKCAMIMNDYIGHDTEKVYRNRTTIN